MTLAIVGSRKLDDYSIIEDAIWDLGLTSQISFIVSGGAKGADTLGILYAQIHKIPYHEHLPDLETYREFSVAAKVRNTLIVNDADVLLAFWDGKSTGTKDSIDKARNQNKPVHIIKI